ncbi:hypothetical protein CALCODRAFT_494505 [Calocera cornea HHB12733]|uniref:Uncharacterized protein n=1 Tax=Calocera cornea HHB12733 TaxID=1353952 RepID=A0A165H2X7_9BASI|nr:hypothetical protein CALCODRAFT_494505 [Calocera cornea HHB12733]
MTSPAPIKLQPSRPSSCVCWLVLRDQAQPTGRGTITSPESPQTGRQQPSSRCQAMGKAHMYIGQATGTDVAATVDAMKTMAIGRKRMAVRFGLHE